MGFSFKWLNINFILYICSCSPQHEEQVCLEPVSTEQSCCLKKRKKKKQLSLPGLDKGSTAAESEHRKHKRREKLGGSASEATSPSEELSENGLCSARVGPPGMTDLSASRVAWVYMGVK